MQDSPIQKNKVSVILPRISRLFILFGLTTFFIAFADSLMSYFLPTLMTNSGLSNTEMGILYSSSAVFGAIFDFLLSKYLKSTHYKRMYFYTIVLAIVFPIMMFMSSWFWIYLAAMMVWGLYYNIWNFGYYDFVSREQNSKSYASSFGILSMFNDIGYLVGPLIAAQFVLTGHTLLPMISPIFLVLLAAFFFMGVIFLKNKERKKRKNPESEILEKERDVSFLKEVKLWYLVSKRMWPILLMGISLSITSAMFWVVTPLLDGKSEGMNQLGGILLTASLAPSLFVNWSVGTFTNKFGKKYTAFAAFLLSNLILLSVGFISNPYIIILAVFLSSLFSSISYPALSATVADYLKESKSYDNEILSVKDFFGNVGCIIGPLVAGFLMDRIGSLMIFSYFAVFGIAVSIFLLFFSPKSIDFHDRSMK
jgi:MFS family permease